MPLQPMAISRTNRCSSGIIKRWNAHSIEAMWNAPRDPTGLSMTPSAAKCRDLNANQTVKNRVAATIFADAPKLRVSQKPLWFCALRRPGFRAFFHARRRVPKTPLKSTRLRGALRRSNIMEGHVLMRHVFNGSAHVGGWEHPCLVKLNRQG